MHILYVINLNVLNISFDWRIWFNNFIFLYNWQWTLYNGLKYCRT